MSDDQNRLRSDNENDPGRNKRGFDRFGRPFHDLSDNIGSQKLAEEVGGHVIHWYSIASGASVRFKAFLSEFKDRYESQWNDEDFYGRMDPISTFKRTGRVITLGWDVPSASVEEAKFNLREAERFLSMLYPVFEEFEVGQGSTQLTDAADDALSVFREAVLPAANINQSVAEEAERAARNSILSSISAATGGRRRKVGVMVAAPLFKLKFSNLIMDNGAVSINSKAATAGLVGKLSGLTYEPDIEQGFFGHTEVDGVEAGVLIPQTIKFSCEFTVLHTSPLGWRGVRQKRSSAFPYHGDSISKKRGRG
jgi:hypothetical protein